MTNFLAILKTPKFELATLVPQRYNQRAGERGVDRVLGCGEGQSGICGKRLDIH